MVTHPGLLRFHIFREIPYVYCIVRFNECQERLAASKPFFMCSNRIYEGRRVSWAVVLSKRGGKMELDVIYQKNVREGLGELPDRSIQYCVTSPPYYGLRDYGMEGQIGLENTPEKYIKKLTEVFHEVKRVLCDTGTLWIVMADSYAGSGKGAWKNKDKPKETYIPDPDSTVTRIRPSEEQSSQKT